MNRATVMANNIIYDFDAIPLVGKINFIGQQQQRMVLVLEFIFLLPKLGSIEVVDNHFYPVLS